MIIQQWRIISDVVSSFLETKIEIIRRDTSRTVKNRRAEVFQKLFITGMLLNLIQNEDFGSKKLKFWRQFNIQNIYDFFDCISGIPRLVENLF